MVTKTKNSKSNYGYQLQFSKTLLYLQIFRYFLGLDGNQLSELLTYIYIYLFTSIWAFCKGQLNMVSNST